MKHLILIFLTKSALVCAGNVGIYFGSFDPPHRGHFGVAEAAIKALELDRIYMLPNVKPTGKILASSFHHRYEMVKLITLKNRQFKILPEKLMRKVYLQNPRGYIGPMISTLREIEGKNQRYYHLCGTDSFLKMKEYGRLPALEENRIIAVMQREGYKLPQDPRVDALVRAGKVVFLNPGLKSFSSTRLRKSFSHQTPPGSKKLFHEIGRYVRQRGLYNYKPTRGNWLGL